MEARGELLAVQQARHGAADGRVVEARVALAQAEERAALPEQQRRVLEAAEALEGLAGSPGNWDEPRSWPLLERALDLREQLPALDPAGRARLLDRLAGELQMATDSLGASRRYRQAAAIWVRVLGPSHPQTRASRWEAVNTLLEAAEQQFARGQYARAAATALEVQRLQEEYRGAGHSDVRAAQALHAYLARVAGLGDGELGRWREAAREADEAHKEPGPTDRALEHWQKAVALMEGVFGKANPYVLGYHEELAACHERAGHLDRAEALWRQMLATVRGALGEDSLQSHPALLALATVAARRGDEPRARQYRAAATALVEQAKPPEPREPPGSTDAPEMEEPEKPGRVMKPSGTVRLEVARRPSGRLVVDRLMSTEMVPMLRLPGDDTCAPARSGGPSTAGLQAAARALVAAGDFASAEPLCRQWLDLTRPKDGPPSAEHAAALGELGALYGDMGDYARAGGLLRKAADADLQLGRDHRRGYAVTQYNRAVVALRQRQFAEAETQLGEALWDLGPGPDESVRATCLISLALAHARLGRARAAEGELREAVRLLEGRDSPGLATALNNLGCVYRDRGEFTEAEPRLVRGRDMRSRLLRGPHPELADSYYDLGLFYLARGQAGDKGQAARCLREALEVTRKVLDAAAVAQSERQQLAMAAAFREQLNAYLAPGLGSAVGDEAAYAAVLAWKGQVTARQLALRLARADQETRDPEVLDCAHQLGLLSRQLVRAWYECPAVPPGGADGRGLPGRREQAEADLARRLRVFAGLHASRTLTPADLRQLLGQDTALVDFVEHGLPGSRGTGPRVLTAFVVRHDRVVRKDLGDAAVVTAAVKKFLTTLTRRQPVQGPDDPAVTLRKLMWGPVEPQLVGATTVLVSPGGILNGLPFAALPGKDPGNYLLEEVKLAVLPVPRLLPELLRPRASAPGNAPPRLLLVGNIDYGAGGAGPSPEGGGPQAAQRWRAGLGKGPVKPWECRNGMRA